MLRFSAKSKGKSRIILPWSLCRHQAIVGRTVKQSGKPSFLIFAFCLLLFVSACRQDMHDQPRYRPLGESDFFADGQMSRPLVPGTVPRGSLKEDAHFYTGMVEGRRAETFPFPITKEELARGRERYNISCTPCHGVLGDGEGMVVKRGFRHPPSFHIERLRQEPVGHFFDVITNGFGAMPSHADQISPRDRWLIIAYIRALQLSQNAKLEDVPADKRGQLSSGGGR